MICPLVDIANHAKWNFFEIMCVIESKVNEDLSKVMDSLYKSVEYIASTETDRQLLQSSFRAFLATRSMDDENMRLARAMNEEIVTESESEGDLDAEVDSEAVKTLISKRFKSIKRRNQRQKAKMIAERKFFSRNFDKEFVVF